MGVKQLTDLAIDPATGDYVYTSLKLSDGRMTIPKGYTKLNTLDLSNNTFGGGAGAQMTRLLSLLHFE